jgi:hypothetical protein
MMIDRGSIEGRSRGPQPNWPELHAMLLVPHREMTMSLRNDFAVFREPGFHVSALFTVLSLAGLLVFCGLAVS